MKRCPMCNRTERDVGLNFCTQDGTPLVSIYDSEAETLRTITTTPISNPQKLVITPRSRFHPNITYPLKLYLDVDNTRREPVAIESIAFEISDRLRLQPGIKPLPGTTNHYRPRFRVWQTLNAQGKKDDQYRDRCILEPNETILAFVPIDPAIGEDALAAAIESKTVGVWRYRCAWFGDQIVIHDYKDKF